jgi:hypothetical protein
MRRPVRNSTSASNNQNIDQFDPLKRKGTAASRNTEAMLDRTIKASETYAERI